MLRNSMAVIAIVALTRSPAAADEEEPRHIATAIAESAILLGFLAGMYERNLEQARDDFDLHWDWPSWRRKLSFDAVRFDTNAFGINAFRHPLMGTVQYHIGRTNNLGMLGSQVLSTLSVVVWEYVIEYREYPSINDLIINATTGIEIGEPLWQIGQLWRGGVLTVGDRLKTAVFSPLDVAHDLVGRRPKWRRPAAWRSIAVDAGALYRLDTTRGDAVVGADIDLVADKHYLADGPSAGPVKAGSWSRIRGRIELGGVAGDTELVGVRLESRTAFAGRYTQNSEGRGTFLGIGTAFTYRRELLAGSEWDHVAISHLVGPQVQLSYRTPAFALRWDVDAYGDFALIDAHAIGDSSPFLPPPPFGNALQSHGYYDGVGASVRTRLRFDTRRWSVDGELAYHRIWQIDHGDRAEQPEARATEAFDPHGASDVRGSARLQLTYRWSRFGLGAIAEGDVRGGSWRDIERVDTGTSFGLLGHVDL